MIELKNGSKEKEEPEDLENDSFIVNSRDVTGLIPVRLESQNGRVIHALNEKHARIARLADKGAIVAAKVSQRDN